MFNILIAVTSRQQNAGFFSLADIHYLHNTIIQRFYPPKKTLHRHYFRFSLGRLHVPGEIANNHYAKLLGVKEVYYGICASRELLIGVHSMLNTVLLLLVIIIFLHHHVRESSLSCPDETHSLHGAAKSFYAIEKVELVFILIVNF